MDDKQLKNFMKLYELRNMHKAAEELFISQQGLSKSIQALDKDLRVQLFERDNNGMRPTMAGDYFFQKMMPLRNRMMQIRKNTRIIGGGRAQLRISYSFGSMQNFYERFASYLKQHKDIDLYLAETTDHGCYLDVENSRASIAVCSRFANEGAVNFKSIYTCPMVCVSSNQNKGLLSYQDLEGKQIIIANDEYAYNKYFKEHLLNENIEYHILVHTTDLILIQKLLSTEDCYVILPESQAMQLKGDYHLQYFEDSSFIYELGFATKNGVQLSGIYKDLMNYLFNWDK